MAKYSKFIVALLGAVVAVVVAQYSDNTVVQSLIPFLTAIGVYQVKNN